MLKTARNQWIKARPAPPPPSPANGSNGGGNGNNGNSAVDCDFWVPTNGLPLVAGGAVLQPDVFRMTHSDSLPMVGGYSNLHM